MTFNFYQTIITFNFFFSEGSSLTSQPRSALRSVWTRTTQLLAPPVPDLAEQPYRGRISVSGASRRTLLWSSDIKNIQYPFFLEI